MEENIFLFFFIDMLLYVISVFPFSAFNRDELPSSRWSASSYYFILKNKNEKN